MVEDYRGFLLNYAVFLHDPLPLSHQVEIEFIAEPQEL